MATVPMRITAIIPVELVAEFIEGPVCGVWERRAAVTAARTGFPCSRLSR